MKRTGQSCLAHFAAVQTCCVVTVRLPQTRYFQSCPFVLPACQAGIFPNCRKTSTKMSGTVLPYSIVTRSSNICFVSSREQEADALQVTWLFLLYYFCLYSFTEKAQIRRIAYQITTSSSRETSMQRD